MKKHWLASLILSASIASPVASAHAAETVSYILTGHNPARLRSAALRAGATIQGKLRYHSGWVIRLTTPAAERLESMLTERGSKVPDAKLERDDIVRAADSGLIDINAPSGETLPWGVAAIHAPEAFSRSRGRGAVVCVIDTGVQSDHPDLIDNVIGGENTIVDDRRPHQLDASDYADDNGHGTHVSGIIAAEGKADGVIGVAPEAKIFAVKALDGNGTGNHSSLAEGIRSCMAHRAQVINMSVAFGSRSPIVEQAVSDAISAGLILVAAAGNDHSGVSYPARYSGVLAVSALDKNLRFASFSNYGPEVSFAAPGVGVRSTYPDSTYAVMEGTSQASPHVAGVAALVIAAKHGGLKGVDLGLPSDEEGNGRIDALKSLGENLSELSR